VLHSRDWCRQQVHLFCSRDASWEKCSEPMKTKPLPFVVLLPLWMLTLCVSSGQLDPSWSHLVDTYYDNNAAADSYYYSAQVSGGSFQSRTLLKKGDSSSTSTPTYYSPPQHTLKIFFALQDNLQAVQEEEKDQGRLRRCHRRRNSSSYPSDYCHPCAPFPPLQVQTTLVLEDLLLLW
jgi:hypothetical protein